MDHEYETFEPARRAKKRLQTRLSWPELDAHGGTWIL